tara:strand:- start:12289 stop:13584 length:1296 start_codon:yes stop_codon:yes gene_type:complete
LNLELGKKAGDSDAELRAREWRENWPLVLACLLGMSFPSAAYYALGLFIDPLTAEFGWNRTQVSAGASIGALVAIPLAPVIGILVDRWGVRRLALPGIVLTGATMAALSLADGTNVQWLVLWGVFGVASMLLKATLWATAISSKFVAARSMALAVALSGSAVSMTLAPPIARWLIDNLGWRDAWVALGLGWAVPALALSLFFLFDAHDDMRRSAAANTAQKEARTRPDLPGLTIREAARSLRIYRIAGATLLMLLLVGAFVVHKVPILVEAGLVREDAAYLASLSGVASIVGSLAMGWLIDRYDAGLVGGLTNAIAGIALILLLEPFRVSALIVISMIILGFAGGAKVQLCAYMVSRYAGLRNYGKIFGVMGSIIAITGAVAPTVGGLAYDLGGSYDLLIMGGIPVCFVAAILIFGLGPYPDWSRNEASGK